MKNLRTVKLACLLCLLTFASTRAQYKTDDWAARDKWQKVPELLKAMNIKPGAKVADVGCHQGYMSMYLAKAVGTSGKVYSVDLDAYKLSILKDNAKERGFENITTIEGKYDDPLLPAGQLDAIIMMETYHEVSKPIEFLKKLKKALKPGGRLVIMDAMNPEFKKSSREKQIDKHTVDIGFVRYDFKKAGLKAGASKYPLTYWKNKKDRWLWYLVGVKLRKI